ncbi:hypothetical protein JW962_02600, partial [Candidatus Dojkabacteria bacterium]|nr:hypothetical protein [Candidatus Dojkabacteria bacterium]
MDSNGKPKRQSGSQLPLTILVIVLLFMLGSIGYLWYKQSKEIASVRELIDKSASGQVSKEVLREIQNDILAEVFNEVSTNEYYVGPEGPPGISEDGLWEITDDYIYVERIGSDTFRITESGNLYVNDLAIRGVSLVNSIIGPRRYTEDNYLTDYQTITASLNQLDMVVYDLETGVIGLWSNGPAGLSTIRAVNIGGTLTVEGLRMPTGAVPGYVLSTDGSGNATWISVALVGEVDPVYTGSVASGITGANITNWNTAYGWGDHSTMGYLTAMSAESDPLFTAHVSSGITGTDITNWNTAYGWGDHSSAGYLTSYAESDPLFTAHVSSGIT